MAKMSKATRRIAYGNVLVIIDSKEAYLFTVRQYIHGVKSAQPKNEGGKWHYECYQNSFSYWGNYPEGKGGNIEFNRNTGMGFGWGKHIQDEAIAICNRWGFDPKSVNNITTIGSEIFDIQAALAISNYIHHAPQKRVHPFEYSVGFEVRPFKGQNPDGHDGWEKEWIGHGANGYDNKKTMLVVGPGERNKYSHICELAKKVSNQMADRYPKKGMLKVGHWRRPTIDVTFVNSFGIPQKSKRYMTDEELGL